MVPRARTLDAHRPQPEMACERSFQKEYMVRGAWCESDNDEKMAEQRLTRRRDRRTGYMPFAVKHDASLSLDLLDLCHSHIVWTLFRDSDDALPEIVVT